MQNCISSRVLTVITVPNQRRKSPRYTGTKPTVKIVPLYWCQTSGENLAVILAPYRWPGAIPPPRTSVPNICSTGGHSIEHLFYWRCSTVPAHKTNEGGFLPPRNSVSRLFRYALRLVVSVPINLEVLEDCSALRNLHIPLYLFGAGAER